MKLPIVIPKYQTVPTFTQGLAIIYAHNGEYADRWVINNCLSMRFTQPPDKRSTYLHILPVFVNHNCCLLEMCKIPVFALTDLYNTIYESILNKHYFTTSVDAFYLPCHNAAYNTFHFVHPIIVYGIEDEHLMVADHFLGNNGVFCTSVISYDELLQGYVSAHGEFLYRNYYRGVYLLRYKSEIGNYNIDVGAIKYNVMQHLCAAIDTKLPDYLDYNYAKLPYGISALNALIEFFKTSGEFSNEHIRLLHELLIHASIAALVIDKLNLTSLLNLANEYTKKCIIGRNVLMKQLAKGRSMEFQTAYLEELYELDKKIYTEIAACI